MQTMLRPEWSRKMRFFSFVSMVLLVYVHGYDLNDRYLQPFSFVSEKMTLTAFTEHFTANGIFRFRIPMLFAISGYLLAQGDSKGYAQIIRRRFRTLALPFLIWSALAALIAFGLYNWSFTHESVSNIHMQPTPRNWNEFDWHDWRDTIFFGNVAYQLWFIRSLFMLNLAYPLLRAGVQKKPALLFTVVSILWLLTPWSPLFLLPQQLMGEWMRYLELGEGLLPFCLGIWLCKRGKDLSKAPRWFSVQWGGGAFLALVLFKTWLAFHPFAFFGAEGPARLSLMFLYKCTVAAGLLVAWFGSDRISEYCMRQRWFVHATAYAFIIYALHVPLVTYLIDPVHGLLSGFAYYRILTYALLPLSVILFSMAVGALLRYTVPSFYSLLTGDRGLRSLPVNAPGEKPVVRVLPADAPVLP
jgi:fucose 4-O-acetylase-like acetyltransferase